MGEFETMKGRMAGLKSLLTSADSLQMRDKARDFLVIEGRPVGSTAFLDTILRWNHAPGVSVLRYYLRWL